MTTVTRSVRLDDWSIAHDPDESGIDRGWSRTIVADALPAHVPGIAQMAFPRLYGVFWYWTRITRLPSPDAAAVIEFDGVDHAAQVWIDGIHIGHHAGAEEAFALPLPLNARPGSLVAVRVVNPTESGSGGTFLRDTPHRNKSAERFSIGQSMNHGGITADVRLRSLPAVEIASINVRSTLDGVLRISSTLVNALDRDRQIRLDIVVRDGATVHQAISSHVVVGAGERFVETNLQLLDVTHWSPSQPHLYIVEVAVADESGLLDSRSTRHGVRELRVVDGWFELNGERIFVLCAHTGNHVPWGQQIGVIGDQLQHDLVLAKTAGLNMVRFIAGVATPAQLDLCDELGLMVYEECYAAWELGDSPQALQAFDDATVAMVQRDRHHASVVIWGMLNETERGAVFDQAVRVLPKVREVDDTRLVLLSSGRWDQRPSVGSVSNPGSNEWEHVWGADGEPDVERSAPIVRGFVASAGDIHLYPPAPHPPATITQLRTLGRDSKPVFVSEHGIGSALDAIAAARGFRRRGIVGSQDGELYARIERRFLEDWDRYDLGRVLPDPETLFEISLADNARRRHPGTLALRANPMVAGYSLSGLVDQGFSGEGLWTTWRDLKPGMLEMLRAIAAPEQVGIFVTYPEVLPHGDPVIDLVLMHEHGPRASPWHLDITVGGPSGYSFTEQRTLAVGTEAPFVTEVGRLVLPPLEHDGQYRVTVRVDGDLLPGSRAMFSVASVPQLTSGVATDLCGAAASLQAALTEMGADVALECLRAGAVAVVTPDGLEGAGVARRLAAGETVLVCNLTETTDVGGTTVAVERRTRFLYNREEIVLDHPLVQGTLPLGVADWDTVGPLMSDVFIRPDASDETAALAVYSGFSTPAGYHSGASLLLRRVGPGRLLLTTWDLIGANAEGSPTARKLLASLVGSAGRAVRM